MNLLGKTDVWDNLIRVKDTGAAAELLEISFSSVRMDELEFCEDVEVALGIGEVDWQRDVIWSVIVYFAIVSVL
jgi:hypothetical protein